MQLRRFTQAGIDAFRSELAGLRADPAGDTPVQLLSDARYTEKVEGEIELDDCSFNSRRDAAEYLRDLLDPFDNAAVAEDAGLWTWLTLYYFDDICPTKSGLRSVKNDYYYIYEPKNQRHWYRHLLQIAWRIIKWAPSHNRLFLDVPVAALDKATAEVFKRLYITRIPGVYEVLDKIYWDENLGRIRRGVVNPRGVSPGDLSHRFPNRLRQLEKSFDLQSLSPAQLIELLGPEFDFWNGRALAVSR